MSLAVFSENFIEYAGVGFLLISDMEEKKSGFTFEVIVTTMEWVHNCSSA